MMSVIVREMTRKPISFQYVPGHFDLPPRTTDVPVPERNQYQLAYAIHTSVFRRLPGGAHPLEISISEWDSILIRRFDPGTADLILTAPFGVPGGRDAEFGAFDFDAVGFSWIVYEDSNADSIRYFRYR